MMFVHTKDSWNARTACLWFNGRIQRSWLSAFTIFAVMLQTFRTPHSALSTWKGHLLLSPALLSLQCLLPHTSCGQPVPVTSPCGSECVHGVLSLLHESTLCLQTVYLTVSLLILDFPVCDTGQAIQNLATYICSLREQMLLILFKKKVYDII